MEPHEKKVHALVQQLQLIKNEKVIKFVKEFLMVRCLVCRFDQSFMLLSRYQGILHVNGTAHGYMSS